MARVTGIGGVFLKAQKPDQLAAWYQEQLGMTLSPWSGVEFEWREKDSPETIGKTVWTLFPANTEHFGPGPQQAMINYRVDDLDGLLRKLEEAGVEIDLREENDEYGRFAWIIDPEGNRIELWEPPLEKPKP
ncbi:MAG: VOC family protein [Acidobacteriaceae bacterium]|jgi:predicted enzyme related to lactoylglutathione lyase